MKLWTQWGVLVALATYFYHQTASLDIIDWSDGNKTHALHRQMMKGLELTEYRVSSFGKKDWKLKAQYASSDSPDKSWTVEDALVHLYKDNVQVVEILSNTGFIDIVTKNFFLKGEVRSETGSGYVYQSYGLDYKAVDQTFSSNGDIYIEGPDRKTILKGTSFSGDIKKGFIFIGGPVYCEQNIPAFDKAIIKSKEASIHIESRHVSFRGKVSIHIGKMSISARSAEFLYSKETEGLEALIIRGDVLASQGEKFASANLLEVRLKEGVFLFQGNPRLVFGENTLVGSEILLYNNGKSVQVLQGKVKSDAKILEGE